MEIYIPEWQPIRLNQIMNIHWAQRYKRKKADYEIINFYAKDLPKAEKKRRVELEIGLNKGQRAGDTDSYFKVMCDGLVRCGMLKNDSHIWCELAPVQFTRGKKYTRIKLIDID